MKKNKKERLKGRIDNFMAVHYNWSAIIIIIFSILCTFLIYSILMNQQPQFTIYKNECRNETGYYSGYKCEDGSLLIGGYDNYLEIVTLEGIRCFKNNDTWKREVCEQKKVQEIKYSQTYSEMKTDYIFNDDNRAIKYLDEVTLCLRDKYFEKDYINIDICYTNFSVYSVKIIPKKDLTPSWLDENCECKIEAKDNINIPCKNLECSNRGKGCFEYSCGDYIVEVKK